MEPFSTVSTCSMVVEKNRQRARKRLALWCLQKFEVALASVKWDPEPCLTQKAHNKFTKTLETICQNILDSKKAFQKLVGPKPTKP